MSSSLCILIHQNTPRPSDHGPRVDQLDNNLPQRAALTPWVSRGDSSVVISTITFRVVIIHNNYYSHPVCSHIHEPIFLHDMAPCFTVLNPVHLPQHVTAMPATKYQQVGTVFSKALQSSDSARSKRSDCNNVVFVKA